MPDENELRLTASFDVAPVEAGMAKMQSAIQQQTQKSAQNFAAMKASVVSSQAEMSDSFSHLPVVAEKAGAAGVLAFEEVKRRVIESTKEVASLRDEILHTNDAARLDQLNSQLDIARQKMAVARGELRGMRMEMTETREKADLLGESMGIRIPGAIGRMLGQLPLLQTAMEAAFVPILIFFFADAIEKAAEGIAHAAQEWGGFGDAAKKAYQEALDYNSKMITASLELAEKQRAVGAVGKEGAAKYAIETQNAQQSLKEMNTEITRTSKELEKTNQAIGELSKKTALSNTWLGTDGWKDYGEELKNTEATARRLKGELDSLEEKRRAARPKADTDSAEEGARLAAERRANETAFAEKKKSIEESYVSFYVSGLRQMYSANLITLEEEIEGENRAAEQKLAIERAFVTARKAVLAQETKETGKDNTPGMLALDKQLATAQIATAETVRNNKIRLDEDVIRERNAINLATVEAAKITGDAEIAAAEASAREQFAAKRISLEQETAIMKAAATQRIDEEIAVRREQLRQAEEFPEKNKALIIKLNAEIVALEEDKLAKIEALQAEYEARHIELLKREQEEATRVAEEMANRALEAARRSDDYKLRTHQISLNKWVADERAALDRWYAQEHATLQAAVDFAARTFGTMSLEYKKALDKMIELDQKFQQQKQALDEKASAKFQQSMNVIGNSFTSAFDKMLTEHVKFSTVVQQFWASMVQGWARMGIQIVAGWVQSLAQMLAETILKVAAIKAVMALLGIQAPQAQAATDAAATQEKIQEDTDRAAADVFVQAIEYFPFPANLAAAPAAAALVIAEMKGIQAGGAIASAAGGMDVKKDQMAMIHAKEVVLPAHLAETFRAASDSLSTGRNAASGVSAGLPDAARQALAAAPGQIVAGGGSNAVYGGNTSSKSESASYKTMHNRINIEMHSHGSGMSDDDIVAAVQRGIRSGAMKFTG